MNSMDLEFKVKKLNEKAVIPSKREEDSGYDLYGIIEEDYLIINPGESKVIGTGLAVELPKGYGLVIANRSGNGSKGLVYGAHIIDSGYRGEVFINVHNISNKVIVITDLDFDEFRSRVISKINELEGILDKEEISMLIKDRLKQDKYTLIKKSKALVQAMIIPTLHLPVVEVDELSESERGDGTMGSSGK